MSILKNGKMVKKQVFLEGMVYHIIYEVIYLENIIINVKNVDGEK